MCQVVRRVDLVVVARLYCRRPSQGEHCEPSMRKLFSAGLKTGRGGASGALLLLGATSLVEELISTYRNIIVCAFHNIEGKYETSEIYIRGYQN